MTFVIASTARVLRLDRRVGFESRCRIDCDCTVMSTLQPNKRDGGGQCPRLHSKDDRPFEHESAPPGAEVEASGDAVAAQADDLDRAVAGAKDVEPTAATARMTG